MLHLFIHCRVKGFTKQEKHIPKKTLKKNREDSFEVQLNKNSEGLVTVVVHAMKNV